jgi:hypothetical protein
MSMESIGVMTVSRLGKETLPIGIRTFMEFNQKLIEFDQLRPEYNNVVRVRRRGHKYARYVADMDTDVFVSPNDLTQLPFETVVRNARAVSYRAGDYVKSGPLHPNVSEPGQVWCG